MYIYINIYFELGMGDQVENITSRKSVTELNYEQQSSLHVSHVIHPAYNPS
jgi:hypothetical protein